MAKNKKISKKKLKKQVSAGIHYLGESNPKRGDIIEEEEFTLGRVTGAGKKYEIVAEAGAIVNIYTPIPGGQFFSNESGSEF